MFTRYPNAVKLLALLNTANINSKILLIQNLHL